MAKGESVFCRHFLGYGKQAARQKQSVFADGFLKYSVKKLNRA
jgi:hypothetical protein